jgi:hypothetical protein
MGTTKPDFSDAGYGQVGCLFSVGGILVGSVVALVLLPFLPTRLPPDGQDLLFRLGGIGALAYVVGSAASVGAMTVVGRVRALWKHGDTLVFLANLIAAGVVVPLGVHVGVIGDRAWTISILAIVLVLVLIGIELARSAGRPPTSRPE